MSSGGKQVQEELKAILSSLDSQIRSESISRIGELRRQVARAEVSSVFVFLSFALRALVGNCLPTVERMLLPGGIRDLRDTISTAARELKTSRDEAESRAETLLRSTYPGHIKSIGDLLQSESETTEDIASHEQKFAGGRSSGLRTCISNICEIITSALERGQEVQILDEITALGQGAAKRIESVARNWIKWNCMINDVYHQHQCPCIRIPPGISVTDNEAVQAIGYIRVAMKLRRQHHRLAALGQRIATCVQVCDALGALHRSVIIPDQHEAGFGIPMDIGILA